MARLFLSGMRALGRAQGANSEMTVLFLCGTTNKIDHTMFRYIFIVRHLTLMALQKAGYKPTQDLYLDDMLNHCFRQVDLWLAATGVKAEFLRNSATLDYAKFEELCQIVITHYNDKKKVDRIVDPPTIP